MARYVNSVPQLSDGDGDPISGAKKYMFEQGSSTLKTIYSDVGLTLPTTNPVVTDADGRFPSFFLDGLYKEVQFDANGEELWSRDPVGLEKIGQWLAWESWETYSISEIVFATDGEYYRSLVNNNFNNDPTTSAANWEELELGRIYNATISYPINATVYASDGNLYRSTVATNLNNDPTTSREQWWPAVHDLLSVAATGTDTYVATYGEKAYTSGRIYYVNIANTNTIAAPTLNLDSLGAKTIKKNGTEALLDGDMPIQCLFEYNGTDMILLNPTIPDTGVHISVSKAWVNFDGSGTAAIRDDYNVTSLADNGVGLYTITLDVTMSNANYCPVANGKRQAASGGNDLIVNCAPTSTTTFTISTFSGGDGITFEDVSIICATVHGDLA